MGAEEIAKVTVTCKRPVRSRFPVSHTQHTHMHVSHSIMTSELPGIITIKRNREGIKLSLVS